MEKLPLDELPMLLQHKAERGLLYESFHVVSNHIIEKGRVKLREMAMFFLDDGKTIYEDED